MNRILGIDYGERRIGISISDSLKIIALPLMVIDRKKSRPKDIASLRFFINNKIRTQPNKNKSNGILFPDNNAATRCRAIAKVDNGMLKFLFFKVVKI